MKSASAAFARHIDQECTTLSMCVKLVLTTYQPQIVNITRANPGVIELLWAADYLDGDSARIVNVRGMTELNRQDVQLTKIDDTHYSIGIDTTTYGEYSVKGELRKIVGFTQFIRDITFQNLLYRATVGYMPKSIKGGSDLSVDNLEIVGLMADKVKAQAQQILIEGLSNEDLEVGRLDHAHAEIFWLNYEDLTRGRLIMPGSANIGQTKMRRGVYEAELRGKQLYLQQTVGDLYSKLCRARIGDDVGDGTNEHDYKKQGYGCRVRLDPPFWQSLKAYTVREPYDAHTGSVVKPNVYTGRHLKCITAGTSGFIEPDSNLAIGATIVDGTAEWETIQALTVFGSVTGAIDRRYFVDDARNEPPNTGQGVNTIQAQYAIRALDQGTKFFEIDGDLASYFTTGTTFAITGSIGNDAIYTTVVAAFLGTRTRITVSEAIPDANVSGSIGAPLTLPTGFLAYGKLTFLTGLNKGIAKEVKAFTLSQYAIVDVDTGTDTLMVAGDQTSFFAVNQRFPVTNSTGLNLSYDITAVNYNSGTDQTEITVAQNIAFATADGSILSGPALIELFERTPFEIAVGDEYVAHAGCDWSKALCRDRFDNVYNRRAEDEIPGTDISLLFPDRPTA